jgi:ribosomal-protein-alanine N-acetyltransferase
LYRFRPSHLADVMAIEHASFGDDAYPASLFRLYAADPHSLFLTARTGGGLVGYIIARADRWGAEIVSLAVMPSSRNRGIGRRLMTAAVRYMSQRDAKSVRLMVRHNNSIATAFYRRQGFRPVSRVAGYYEDGAAAIRMRLQPHRRE